MKNRENTKPKAAALATLLAFAALIGSAPFSAHTAEAESMPVVKCFGRN